MVAASLLTACVGPTYYPAQPSGEGSYYIARSPGASMVASYDAAYRYSSFPVYGIDPWWSYSYYSPYFYPHHFSIWQPGWPYYADPYWAWYGGYPYGFLHSGHDAYGWHRRHPSPRPPGVVPPGLPTEPPAVGTGPGHPTIARELYRDRDRRRDSRRQAPSTSVERWARPVTRPFEPPSAAASISGSRSFSMPALPASGGRAVNSRDGSGRSPLQRDP